MGLSTTDVLWLTLACLWAGGSAQDLTALNNKLQQLTAYRDLDLFADHGAGVSVNDHLEAAKKSFQTLKAFWMPDLDNLEQLKSGNESRNLSSECFGGTIYLLNTTDPTTRLPLFVRMVDAMGKIGPGIFEGNFYASGAYDECLDIGLGVTEYCVGDVTLKIKSPIPLTWHYGMCVPRGCTPEDVKFAVETMTVGQMFANLSTISCVSTRRPPYNAGAIVMILVCCIFVTLVMAATIFDFIIQQLQTITSENVPSSIQDDTLNSKLSEKAPLLTKAPDAVKRVKLYDFITAFSLFKVLSQILSTKQPPSAITSINGLRVMSMFWVILCHTHIWVFIVGADNVARIRDVLSKFSFQAIGNAFFSVDSFFFLSGLLVAYLSMREMKRKNGRFPFLTYYLHRYLRLTPTYAFVLFFIWFLMMHLTDGPTYHLAAWEESPTYKNCKSYWWTNLLYINNLYPWNLTDECIGWTWYLANDMQFYVFSPLILIPLYFLFPLGLVIAAIVLFSSFVISGTLAGVYDIQANVFAQFAYNYETNNTFPYTNIVNLLYIKPWYRITPYIVGLILGYVLYRFRLTTKRYVNYPVFSILWILSGIFLVSTLYGLYFTWHGHTPSMAENIIYIMFSRFTWSLGLALLVFACHYGYGGPINWFLSMKFWIPLSRISYNAYLLHPLILTVIFGSERKVIHYQDYNLAVYAVGVAVLSYGAAAVVSVFVEFPIGNLEQALFKLVGLGRHESARTGGEGQHQEGVPEHVHIGSPLHPQPFIGKHNST